MNRFGGIGLTANPRVIALLTCERIIVEQGTGKRSLIDLFEIVYAQAFPTSMPKMSVHIQLQKGTNETDQIFIGMFAPDGQPILQSGIQIQGWPENNELLMIDLNLPQIAFTTAGFYDLRVFVAGEVLAQRRIEARTPPPPQEEGVHSDPIP